MNGRHMKTKKAEILSLEEAVKKCMHFRRAKKFVE
jgi:hypothetical protein